MGQFVVVSAAIQLSQRLAAHQHGRVIANGASFYNRSVGSPIKTPNLAKIFTLKSSDLLATMRRETGYER
jgi:hypothetical protein